MQSSLNILVNQILNCYCLLKYLHFATFLKDLLAIFMFSFCPVFP
jgi:hypothetical protein